MTMNQYFTFQWQLMSIKKTNWNFYNRTLPKSNLKSESAPKSKMIQRPLKTLHIILRLLIVICILHCRLARLTGTFKIVLTQCCVLLGLIRRMLDYMFGSFSFAKDKQAFEISQQYTAVRITQNEHMLLQTSETSQNLNIYSYNYQIGTAIFLATKHEK